MKKCNVSKTLDGKWTAGYYEKGLHPFVGYRVIKGDSREVVVKKALKLGFTHETLPLRELKV